MLRNLEEAIECDPEDFDALVEGYLEDARQPLDAAATHLNGGDVKEPRRAAHTLKSNSAGMGAMKLSALCQQIEGLADEGAVDRIPPLADERRARHGARSETPSRARSSRR